MIAIVGAGLGGLRLATRLKQAGCTDFRFNTEVTGMEFDAEGDEWRLRTSEGELRARIVVAAMEPRYLPHVPSLPGLSDLTGRRIADAYLGVSVAGFPNLFLLPGPALIAIEAQVRYIMGCLRMMRRVGSTRLEVRRSVQTEFNRWARRRLARSVRNAGGCHSWPGSSLSYWWRMRRPDPEDYDLDGPALDDSYRGPATLTFGAEAVDADVHLAGHVEPIDGSYRWYGRVSAGSELPTGDVTISVPGGSAARGRLTELDPWGNSRVTGTGRAPFCG